MAGVRVRLSAGAAGLAQAEPRVGVCAYGNVLEDKGGSSW